MNLNRLRAKVLNTLHDGMHCDGNGLYLRVRGGSRSWVFRFSWGGTRHDIGLGSIQFVSLAEARQKALAIRTDIHNGVHPAIKNLKQKRQKEEQTRMAAGMSCTLRSIAKDAIEHKRQIKKLRTPNYTEHAIATLEKNVFPHIGDIPLSILSKQQIADVLKPHWHVMTGATLLSHMRACYSYLIAKGMYEGVPPTDWASGLSSLLPPPPTKAQEHRAALDWRDVPAAFKKIYESKPKPALLPHKRLALAVILCVPRIAEFGTRYARDMDFSTNTLSIHGTKTSADTVLHPIPTQALPFMKPNGVFIFQGARGGRIYFKDTVDFVKECLGVKDITMHGFRSSFSSWCAENEKNPEVREACLKHSLGNKVVLSYMRSDLLEQRRALLQEWADYVTSLTDLR